MIRYATEDDVDRIVDMGAILHAESRFARLPYSREKCTELVCSCLADKAEMVALVAERDGLIIGAMLGFIDDHFFTSARLATDIMVYVMPEFRGSMAGPRLLDFFTAWALSRKVDMIEIGISTGINVEKSSRLYQRLGYQPVGLVFEYKES